MKILSFLLIIISLLNLSLVNADDVINLPPAQPEVSSPLSLLLQATAQTIRRGELAFLFWNAPNAAYCLGSEGIAGEEPRISSGRRRANTPNWGQPMAVQEEFPTWPRVTTTYTLTCYDAIGRSVSQSLTIQVIYDTSIRSFTFTPIGNNQGRLSWVAWGATACTMNGGSFGSGTTVPRQAQNYLVNTLPGTVYTLSCTNPSGGANDTRTVTVPSVFDFEMGLFDSTGPFTGSNLTRTITAGGSIITNISVRLTQGNPEPVSLSVSGCPSNANCFISPAAVIPDANNSILSISTNTFTPAGNYVLTVTGTAASGLSKSTQLDLTLLSNSLNVFTFQTSVPAPNIGVQTGAVIDINGISHQFIVNQQGTLPNGSIGITGDWHNYGLADVHYLTSNQIVAGDSSLHYQFFRGCSRDYDLSWSTYGGRNLLYLSTMGLLPGQAGFGRGYRYFTAPLERIILSNGDYAEYISAGGANFYFRLFCQ